MTYRLMPETILLRRCLFAAVTASLLLTGGCKTSSVDTATENAATEAVASDKETELTGTFTADGKPYTGRVSTQQFNATGQFSVVCQDDTDPNHPVLVQFVFKNEAGTRAGGNFKPAYDQGKDQAPDEASVTFDLNYQSQDGSSGTVAISKTGSGSEIVFETVSVESMSKEKKLVSGKIPF